MPVPRIRRSAVITIGVAALVGAGGPLAASGASTSIPTKPVAVSCNEAAIQQAVHKGGDVVFTSNCTLTLTSTLVFSGTTPVTLDGNGHNVLLDAGGTVRAVSVTKGKVTIAHLTIENGLVSGGSGANGSDGAAGTAGGSGGSPAPVPPGDGGAGATGHSALGGGLNISSGAAVVLNRVGFTDNEAVGGNGGNGGAGGAGAAGGDSTSLGNLVGEGTAGGDGGRGGDGGTGSGGAIANAGHLIVIGGAFSGNTARSGNGGQGGDGGVGGDGGDNICAGGCDHVAAGDGGVGGDGASGGAGGDSYGGAIYSTGYLLVDGSSFSSDAAVGGDPGSGGNGGEGGSPGTSSSSDTTAVVGNGGDGGDGGNSGGAQGGAVGLPYGHGKSYVTSPSFTNDSVTGGNLPSDCTTFVTGCFGSGGTTPGGAGTDGDPGDPGLLGHVAKPDSVISTTTLSTVTLTTKKLAKAKVGKKYKAVVKAAGGIAPYSYKISSLPKGLAATSTGVIHGKPTKKGTKTVSITVTDAQAIPPSTHKTKLKLTVK